MKIAIFSKNPDPSNVSGIKIIIDSLLNANIEISIYKHLSNLINNSGLNHFSDNEDVLKFNPDFLFSIGGDGTLLDSLIIVKDSLIPVLGINTGRLGFLANHQVDDIDAIIKNLLKNEFILESRPVIELLTDSLFFNGQNYALNEFTIHKGMSSTLVTITAYINNEFFNTYWCDGIILSTPTGSTAYSMSCGGPIVFPNSNTFILTPVAPHNLNVRPVIIPDDHELTFEIVGRNSNYIISLDSRFKVASGNIKFTLRKSSFNFITCRFKDQKFSKILRDKLNWGIDKRNII